MTLRIPSYLGWDVPAFIMAIREFLDDPPEGMSNPTFSTYKILDSDVDILRVMPAEHGGQIEVEVKIECAEHVLRDVILKANTIPTNTSSTTVRKTGSQASLDSLYRQALESAGKTVPEGSGAHISRAGELTDNEAKSKMVWGMISFLYSNMTFEARAALVLQTWHSVSWVIQQMVTLMDT